MTTLVTPIVIHHPILSCLHGEHPQLSGLPHYVARASKSQLHFFEHFYSLRDCKPKLLVQADASHVFLSNPGD